MGKELLEGILFWVVIVAGFFFIRPGSFIHQITVGTFKRKHFLFLAAIVVFLIVLMAFVMTLSPMWNGEIIEHKAQYEMITESFLQGRLDFDIPMDPLLLEMENPYDSELRLALHVDCPLDHAYYNGHYYMYFGVVPVFLAFLPYRLLFGESLLSMHASQWFTGIFLVGLAFSFLWLARKKFPRMTLGVFFLLLILFSLLSSLYVAKYPSLYQTPVSCGMMLEIWSLYCFMKAFWEERKESSSLRWAFVGSLLGALTFGCRPPLALANLCVIPLLFRFLKGRRMTWKRAGQLILTVSPYVITAAGLMWYNYARFNNPFEFGQAYQLTTVDQSAYGSIQGLNGFVSVLIDTWNSLFALPPLKTAFPFLPLDIGAFTCCPLLFVSFSGLRGSVKKTLREQGMFGFLVFLLCSVFLTFFFQVIWSPVILERYKSDVLYLLSLGAFLTIGFKSAFQTDPRRFSRTVCCSALVCIILVFLLFMIPEDYSYTAYFPGATERIWNRITFQFS